MSEKLSFNAWLGIGIGAIFTLMLIGGVIAGLGGGDDDDVPTEATSAEDAASAYHMRENLVLREMRYRFASTCGYDPAYVIDGQAMKLGEMYHGHPWQGGYMQRWRDARDGSMLGRSAIEPFGAREPQSSGGMIECG